MQGAKLTFGKLSLVKIPVISRLRPAKAGLGTWNEKVRNKYQQFRLLFHKRSHRLLWFGKVQVTDLHRF